MMTCVKVGLLSLYSVGVYMENIGFGNNVAEIRTGNIPNTAL
jgi:hypothetical protein